MVHKRADDPRPTTNHDPPPLCSLRRGHVSTGQSVPVSAAQVPGRGNDQKIIATGLLTARVSPVLPAVFPAMPTAEPCYRLNSTPQ
jgi:hypothetical protein